MKGEESRMNSWGGGDFLLFVVFFANHHQALMPYSNHIFGLGKKKKKRGNLALLTCHAFSRFKYKPWNVSKVVSMVSTNIGCLPIQF